MRATIKELEKNINQKMADLKNNTGPDFHLDEIHEIHDQNSKHTDNYIFLKSMDDFLTHFPEARKVDSHSFLHKLHTELMSRLEPFFYGKTLTNRYLMFVSQQPDKLKYFSPLNTNPPVTLVSQQFKKYEHVWCLTNIGHFIGHTLFSNVQGLKETLRKKICQAFDNRAEFEECLDAISPGAIIQPEHISGIMSGSMHFYVRDQAGHKKPSLVEDHFLSIMNRIHKNKQFSTDTPQDKGNLKIEFLKYLWLHWLENSFCDIINLVTCGASAILSFVHNYKFFNFAQSSYGSADDTNSTEELIEHFFDIDNCYPLSFRFRFMLHALEYIEQWTGRKYRLTNKIRERLQPVIDILLEKKNIQGHDQDTYRFQNCHFQDINFSINRKFAEKMHKFIVHKIFEGLDDFVEGHKTPGTGNWLDELVFNDRELEEVDDLIFKLSLGSDDVTFRQYRHVLAAGRYAFELFPRKALLINKKSFTCIQQPVVKKSRAGGLVCIEYYFNREKYWDWKIFSRELGAYISSPEDERFSDISRGLAESYKAESYKSEYHYTRVIDLMQERLPSLDQEKEQDIIKRIRIMIHHYNTCHAVRQYNAALESELAKWILNDRVSKGIINEILEHDIFHMLLDNLIEANFMKPGFLDCLEDSLFNISAAEYQRLPWILTDTFCRMNPSCHDAGSLYLLYESGDIFNHKRYYRAIDNWYENRGNTRSIHQEAWKGKIIGKMKCRIFHKLADKVSREKGATGENIISSLAKEWTALFRKNIKNRHDRSQLEYLSWNLERFFLEKIINSATDPAEYVQIIKDSIKKVCSETLLWIHFKNVRHVYKQLVVC